MLCINYKPLAFAAFAAPAPLKFQNLFALQKTASAVQSLWLWIFKYNVRRQLMLCINYKPLAFAAFAAPAPLKFKNLFALQKTASAVQSLKNGKNPKRNVLVQKQSFCQSRRLWFLPQHILQYNTKGNKNGNNNLLPRRNR